MSRDHGVRMMRHRTIVLFVVFGSLLAYVIFFERHGFTTDDLEGQGAKLVPGFDRDRVARIEIERPHDKTVLARTLLEPDAITEDGEPGDESFRLVEPAEAAADANTVDSLLGSLEWASARRTLSDIGDADRRRFGLTEPRVRVRITVDGRTTELRFGSEDPQGAGVYMDVDAHGDRALVVGKDVFEAVDNGPNHFRSRELWSEDVDLTRVSSLRLRVTGAPFATEGQAAGRAGDGGVDGEGSPTAAATATEHHLERRDDAWWVGAPHERRASAPAVREILHALDGLRGERVIVDDDEDPSRYGLDSPRLALVIDEGDGATLRLDVGAPCADHEGESYARAGEGPVVCVLDTTLSKLAPTAAQLVEDRLLTVGNDEVHRFESVAGDRRLSVERGEDGFRYRFRSGAREQEGVADEGGIDELLRGLRDARATEIVDVDEGALRTLGLADPSIKLTLYDGEGHEQLVLRFGAADAETVWARRGEDPSCGRFPLSAYEAVRPSALSVRSRSLLAIDDEACDSLVVTRAGQSERMARGEEGWSVVEPGTGAMDVDQGRLREVLRGLAGLTALRFAAERATAEHGLSPVALEATLTCRSAPSEAAADGMQDGSETHTLTIGANDARGRTPDSEPGAFARLDDNPEVFVVSAALRDALATPLSVGEGASPEVASPGDGD